MLALASTLFFQPLPVLSAPATVVAKRVSQAVEPPSPASVFGFTPGTSRRMVDWTQISDYFQRLDAASDRVLVQQIGTTTLGKPLLATFISEPETLRNLEKHRQIQKKLADPRLVKSSEAEALLAQGKTVVAISCSIHSTEVVASQISTVLAHELATARDSETAEILRNTIVILIPSLNPDGIDIVASWYRRTLDTPFEGTLPPEIYHHYAGHDNNRDWTDLNLAESRHVSRLLWQQWHPQIVYDIHQQGQNGTRMVVPPFFEPSNPNIPPLILRQIGQVGYKMATDLQAAGYLGVSTNATYDTWMRSSYRTTPNYHNAVGILSEAASSRLMSPIEISREQLSKTTTRGISSMLESATNFPNPWPGGTWRPEEIAGMERVAVRAVLSQASKFRADYLRNFYALNQQALAPNPKQPVAYALPAAQRNPEATAKLLAALIGQGVEVHRLTGDLEGVQVEGDSARRTLVAGTHLIYLAQPQRANVQSLFEKQAYPNRRDAQGNPERPYDITAWTIWMQMGVEALPVRDLSSLPTQAKVADAAEVRSRLGLGAKPVNPLRRPVRLGLYKSVIANGLMDEGWTRYLFDTFSIPYQSIGDKDVRAGSLRGRYDVILLPAQEAKQIAQGNASGSYPPEYTGGLGESGAESLRRFVAEGGTVIAFDEASDYAIETLGLPVRNATADLKPAQLYGPGSIVRLALDAQHPIARAQPAEVDAYFIGSRAFEVTDPSSVQVIARYAPQNLLRSGWLVGESYLAGKPALVEIQQGKGRVILFGFPPQHRGQTWGTFGLIFNALARSVP